MQQSSNINRLSVKGSAVESTVASTLDSTVASTLDSTVASKVASSSTMDSTVASDSTVNSTVASTTASTVDSTVTSNVATDSSRIIEAQSVHTIERIGTAHIHFPDSAPKETTRLKGCVQKLEVENTGLKQLANELKRRLQLEQRRGQHWAATVQRMTAQNERLQAEKDKLKLLANELKSRLLFQQQREQQWAATIQSVSAQKDIAHKMMTQLAKGLFHATYIATGKQIALTMDLLDTVVRETRVPFPRETIKCYNRSRYRAAFGELKGNSNLQNTIHSGKVAVGLLLQSKERLEEFRRTVDEMCKDTTDAIVSVATSSVGCGIGSGSLAGIKAGHTNIGAPLPQMRSAVSSSSVGPPHKRRRVPQSALSPVTAVSLSPLGSGLPIAGRPRSVALPLLSPMRASTRDPKDVSTTKATTE